MSIYRTSTKLLPLWLFVLFCTMLSAKAGDYMITGTVSDAKTKLPLAGVSLRLKETNRGTYSGKSGQFRLKALQLNNPILIVKSIGFQTKEISVTASSQNLTIELMPSELTTEEVLVSAFDVNGIIRKAIEQKKNNLRRVRTLKATLYSKLTSEILGKGIASSTASSNTISFSTNPTGEPDTTSLVMETISEMYIDYPAQKQQNTIIQRRQTRNIDPESNTFALGKFVNFYDNTISIANTTFLSPLADEPFSRYSYTLEDRQTIGDKFVYSIKVTPNSTLFPSFKGTMKIIDGTFQLIEVDLQPAEATPIPLVSNVRFIEKFEEIAPDTWHPVFLKSQGAVNAAVIKGVIEVGLSLQATTIFTDIQLNTNIDDTIWKKNRVVIAKNADSLQSEYWSSNTVEELSEEEKSYYAKNESKNLENIKIRRNNPTVPNLEFQPIFDFNRVSGVTTGIAFSSEKIDNTIIAVSPQYSFALKDLLIDSKVQYYFDSSRKYSAFVKAFSHIQSVGQDKSVSPFINTLGAFILGNDYYDWYKQDGWALGLSGEVFSIKSTLEITESRDFTDTLKVKRSLFAGTEWRRNPAIDNGAYRTVQLTLLYGSVSLQQTSNFQFSIETQGLFGMEYTSSRNFQRYIIQAQTYSPLFSTGYNPISLRTAISAGIANGDIPFQYRLRLQNILTPFAQFGGMYSAPLGLYNGTELFHIQSEVNCTDLWWRALGLPLFENRGIDLYIGGGLALLAKNTPDLRSTSTRTQHYSEIGFGLGRIPTFFSDVLFLRCDIRAGIGPLASGNIGWGLGITLPM